MTATIQINRWLIYIYIAKVDISEQNIFFWSEENLRQYEFCFLFDKAHIVKFPTKTTKFQPSVNL